MSHLAQHSARVWTKFASKSKRGPMLTFILAIWATNPATASAPVDNCQSTANRWINGLSSAGCPPLSRYRNAAMTACTAIPEDGWTRARKAARKALLRDCTPNMDGFPGAQATHEDGRTLSHCSELLMMMAEHPPEAPTLSETTLGVDGMIVAVGAAVFACIDPTNIAACRHPASVHTPAEGLNERIAACKAIASPPFDTTMRSLIWNSGLVAVVPDAQMALLEGLVGEQARIKAQREREQADFKTARVDELERARTLAATCLAMPGEMNSVEETETASLACTELSALWLGEDTVRKSLEESGLLAEPYLSQLRGKVLNGDSYNAADESRVTGRPDILKTRAQDLIDIQFTTLIETDPAAAEAFLDKYRDQMDAEWVADALDQVLAATM